MNRNFTLQGCLCIYWGDNGWNRWKEDISLWRTFFSFEINIVSCTYGCEDYLPNVNWMQISTVMSPECPKREHQNLCCFLQLCQIATKWKQRNCLAATPQNPLATSKIDKNLVNLVEKVMGSRRDRPWSSLRGRNGEKAKVPLTFRFTENLQIYCQDQCERWKPQPRSRDRQKL